MNIEPRDRNWVTDEKHILSCIATYMYKGYAGSIMVKCGGCSSHDLCCKIRKMISVPQEMRVRNVDMKA